MLFRSRFTNHYLRRPSLPPAFFPCPQPEMKRSVLIGKPAPSLLRPIRRTMYPLYQRTSICYFQPRKQSTIYIIVIGIGMIFTSHPISGKYIYKPHSCFRYALSGKEFSDERADFAYCHVNNGEWQQQDEDSSRNNFSEYF